jgi:hypothetical protein
MSGRWTFRGLLSEDGKHVYTLAGPSASVQMSLLRSVRLFYHSIAWNECAGSVQVGHRDSTIAGSSALFMNEETERASTTRT